MNIKVEYLLGPLCGRADVIAAGGQRPGEFRIVTVGERYDSALDDHPAVPAEDHVYRRHGDSPRHDGVWVYRWSGPLR